LPAPTTRRAGLWHKCTVANAGDLTSFTIPHWPFAGWLSDSHNRAPVIL
jgi:putative SOS response-associated peptidase YedK